MTKIKVVAAIVDTQQLKLYKEDGKTVTIPQGDPRVQRIIDETKDDLIAGRVAEVDISHPGEVVGTSMKEFEETSSGLVRFFRVTKSAISSLFGGQASQETPAPEEEHLPEMVIGQFVPKNLDSALEQIMENAIPVTDDSVSPDETVVAVVNNKPIPGAENLVGQFEYANRMGSRQGVDNFLKRIAKVIDERRHSVDDLLKFMSRGDLPIADDGCIIIYKILRRIPKDGLPYVDCHTRNVPQGPGSFVLMAPGLVDPNRHNECSNGLHVARRGYLGNFSGDVCVLAKVRPEDVIAVPAKDANKMRVCAYHILFELSADMFSSLQANQDMTGNAAGQKLLARAMSGDHPSPSEKVEIGGQRGTNITITRLSKSSEAQSTTAKTTEAKPARKKAKAIPLREEGKPKPAPAVNPAKVAKQVQKGKAKTQKENVFTLWATFLNTGKTLAERIEAGEELLTFRKKAKKSWKALGHPKITDDGLTEDIEKLKVQLRSQPKPKPAKVKPKAKTKTPAKKKTATAPAKGTMTRQERARFLFDSQDWIGLAAHKQSVKLGWAKLGFSDAEIRKITNNI